MPSCPRASDRGARAEGILINNCGEISLNNQEYCNLVEVFPTNCDNIDDFKRTLKFAYLYGKTITLTTSSCAQTNREMLKNRRVGVSLSGIQQFLSKHTLEEFRIWCDEGYKTLRYYDDVYSEWMCILQKYQDNYNQTIRNFIFACLCDEWNALSRVDFAYVELISIRILTLSLA